MPDTIEITLIGCAGLLGKQDNGFSDPVVHLNCNGEVQTSTVKQSTNSPVWNETFCWTKLSASHGAPLTLHVWNSPKFKLGPDTKGAFLGTVTIDNVFQLIGKTSTLVLQKRSSRSNVSGSISIRIDDDKSKVTAQPSQAAEQPPGGTGSASDKDAVRASPANISAADAKLLADFVSKTANEQCADCDSKQASRCGARYTQPTLFQFPFPFLLPYHNLFLLCVATPWNLTPCTPCCCFTVCLSPSCYSSSLPGRP